MDTSIPNKKRFLIADDEESILLFLIRTLKRIRPGCQVITANNGVVAWQECQQQSFDLLLTDYEMPGLNGLELAQKVRDLSPGLPVVLMTGTRGAEIQLKTQNIDLAGWLDKPFGVTEIQNMIEALGL